MLSGGEGITVTVNGIPASVDLGTGSNGTFLAQNVPLQPGSTPIAVLEAEWTRIHSDPTVPSIGAVDAIDHVFVRPANRWRVIEVRVIDERIASDHLPLLVVLEWLPENYTAPPAGNEGG